MKQGEGWREKESKRGKMVQKWEKRAHRNRQLVIKTCERKNQEDTNVVVYTNKNLVGNRFKETTRFFYPGYGEEQRPLENQ